MLQGEFDDLNIGSESAVVRINIIGEQWKPFFTEAK